jgi:hypothetical protein
MDQMTFTEKIQIGGQAYHLSGSDESSIVEKGLFNKKEAIIEGEVAASTQWNQVVILSAALDVIARYDRIDEPTTVKGGHRFQFKLPLPPLDDSLESLAGLRFLALDTASQTAREIARRADHYNFNLALTEKNFHPLIQDPSSRIKDKDTLLYYARWFLHRNRDNFTLACSCYCTIGYRLIEAKSLDELRTLVQDCQYLFDKDIDLGKRFDFRWYVSLSLLCGYAELILGDVATAAQYFDRIVNAMENISHTPQMVTNTLKAILLAGFIAENGGPAAGIRYWSKANEALKMATGVWEYENYYSYSELAQSVLLSRECIAAVFLAKRKVDAQSVSVRVFPDKTPVSFANLGFPTTAYGFDKLFEKCGITIQR